MRKGILGNSFLNGAAGIMQLASGFVCSIAVARLLGPEANGIVASALWLVTTAALVAELGTGVLLLKMLPQFAARGFDNKRRLGFAAYLIRPVIAATLILTALYALSYREGLFGWNSPDISITLIVGALLLVQSIGSFTKNYLIGEQELTSFFRLSFGVALVQTLLVVVLAMNNGVAGALIGYLAAQLLPFWKALRIAVNRNNDCGTSPRYLATSSFVLIADFTLSAVFLMRPEFFFLDHFASTESIGFYAIALSVTNIALQLPVQLTGSLLPYYSQAIESEAGHVSSESFQGVIRCIAYITMPMCFGLAAISHSLITSLFGPAFAPAAKITMLLLLGVPAYVHWQICSLYLLSMDRAVARLQITILGSVAMITGGALFIPTYGDEGAALVRSAAVTLMAVSMTFFIKQKHFDLAFLLTMIRITIASCVCGLAAWYLTSIVSGMLGVCIAVPAAMLIYAAVMLLIGALPESDLVLVRQLYQRLRSRFFQTKEVSQ